MNKRQLCTRTFTRTFALAAIVLAAGQLVIAGPYSDYAGAIDTAIPFTVGGETNPIFTAWATGYQNYLPAPDVGVAHQIPESALGLASNTCVSLGDLDPDQIAAGAAPGEITLTFDRAIYNGPGADFAVFENSQYYGGYGFFGELGYVEVSSNGTDFVRFECVSTNPGPVGAFGVIDSTNIYNLVGKHQVFQGTPFNLDVLAGSDAVVGGQVDINDIQYIKIVDIPGSGDFLDSYDNPIYDAWLTRDSAGVDLDAIGAINTVPEPGALALLAGLALALGGCRAVSSSIKTFCRKNRR